MGPQTARTLEGALLGGERRHRRDEVAARAGVGLDDARRLWRAMGFAEVGEDEPAFTDGDVDALRAVRELRAAGLVDPDTEVAMARALGQGLARLAEGEVDTLAAALARRDGAALDPDRAAADAATLLPVMERLLRYVWRRQLAAAAGRLLASGPDERPVLAVGFADLVGFTSLTRRLDAGELGRLVDAFDSTAADVVTARGGRVVKTVGDEVFFVADTAAAAAEIGLTLCAAFAADPDMPPVRVGLAHGPVLTRVGDVYGAPVNLASRLTALARPGTVLVDRALADALAEDPAYSLRRLRRVSVRGYAHLEPVVLRRAEAAGGA